MKHLWFTILKLFITVSVTVAMNCSIVDTNDFMTRLERKASLQKKELHVNPEISVKQLQIRKYSSDECYPWMYYNEKLQKCECSDIPYRAVSCNAKVGRTSILDCYCMTHDHGTNKTYLGICLYGCGHEVDNVYYKLPNNTDGLNNYSCGEYNRDSILCGECLPGFSPLLYSYERKCVNCTGQSMTYNWLKYIAVAYVPLTFFFLLVVISNFNGTSPLFKCYITLVQGVCSPIAVRAFLAMKRKYVKIFVKTICCMYGIWNLDFFRTVLPPICVTNITRLQLLSLDYAVAFYPLILILISYMFIKMYSRDIRIIVWIWKPFLKLFSLFKQNWDLEGSIVKSFATFFLLSYLKIISVTFDIMTFTRAYVVSNRTRKFSVKTVLYNDGSVDYFGREHLPFAILALVIGVFVGIFPLLFLVVYPMRWFQKCLNSLKIQRQAIDILVNCYQGYYKDGTNGTRDYRWFSVVYFVFQLLIFTLFSISQGIYCYVIGILAVMTVIFLHLVLQPYKEEFKIYNTTDGLLLLVMGGFFIMIVAGDEADVKDSYFIKFSYTWVGIFAVLPAVYFGAVALWWLLFKKKLKTVCRRKLLTFRAVPKHFGRRSAEESNHFPHRLENPGDYDPNTPLLSGSVQAPRPQVEPPLKVSVSVYESIKNIE